MQGTLIYNLCLLQLQNLEAMLSHSKLHSVVDFSVFCNLLHCGTSPYELYFIAAY